MFSSAPKEISDAKNATPRLSNDGLNIITLIINVLSKLFRHWFQGTIYALKKRYGSRICMH